ncbi:signal peptide peptidase SppA [Sulfurospirillum deleyianum]|uniref:Signal peptide peptidase SppA, 36K type n=1 Tax=Sulfurospirillum deleyianum (strain ATCC 51133 / DSM 6946 / 5175) TaxID=525898 RepID=D1B0K6_SULD5|nr:signal peptide peptidase SppA [Sulfurospirillum deleyianum]ACZ11325.1 signal peptide peptidase SppA, 36K type [Sulfurospirillum deleyianum DSM 6946]
MLETLKKPFLWIGAIFTYIQNHFKAMLFLLLLVLIFGSQDELKTPNLAIVKLEGEILNVEEILENIDKAQNDENIKGVLLHVDSPGGALAPSIELSMAVKRLAEKKPVVAYAGGSMTSGSYYASIWSNYIIANPGAFIGSIGVLFQAPNVAELAKKLGISEQVLSAGEYKQMGTFTREWTQKERGALKNLIDDAYDLFVKDVATARGLNLAKPDEFANAQVFIASKALNVHLIDEIGSLSSAKTKVEELANITHPVWQKPDAMDKWMKRLESSAHLPLLNTMGYLK